MCIAVILSASIATFGQNALSMLNRVDYYEAVAKNDPTLGTQIQLPTKDILGKTIPQSRKLIVTLGSCESCSIRSFDSRKLTVQTPTLATLFIIQEEHNKISHSLLKSYSANSRYVIADSKQRYQQGLNAQWLPRCYEVDERDMLTWIQPRPHVFNAGISYED